MVTMNQFGLVGGEFVDETSAPIIDAQVQDFTSTLEELTKTATSIKADRNLSNEGRRSALTEAFEKADEKLNQQHAHRRQAIDHWLREAHTNLAQSLSPMADPLLASGESQSAREIRDNIRAMISNQGAEDEHTLVLGDGQHYSADGIQKKLVELVENSSESDAKSIYTAVRDGGATFHSLVGGVGVVDELRTKLAKRVAPEKLARINSLESLKNTYDANANAARQRAADIVGMSTAPAHEDQVEKVAAGTT